MVRVLVPLDGSELAEAALGHLPTLAALGPLQVRLIGVAGEATGVPEPAQWQSRQARLIRDHLAQVQARLDTGDAESDFVVRKGNVARAIIREASRFHADFVLISTHGRTGLNRWRFGSVADKVIRSVACNALVLGPEAAKAPEASGVRSILTPLDGSPIAETALPLAARLARSLAAPLHLVRVVDYMPAEEVTALGMARATKAAGDYLAEQAKEQWQLSPRTEVVTGTPADSLLAYVAQHDVGLVVMTSHGHGGLLRAALGSVADRMIGGPAPVLLVRKDAVEAE